MPLEPGRSKAAFSHNVAEMIRSGHPRDQSVAAAYSEKRRHPRAAGGFTPDMAAIDAALAIARQPSRRPGVPHVHIHPAHAETPRFTQPRTAPDAGGINFMGGLIDAAVHGRTDKIPLNVPSGSYVLPADIVSALGQGNTKAGAAVIQEVAKGAPYRSDTGGAYGASQMPIPRGSGPPGPHPGEPPSPPPNGEHLGDVAGPEPPHMARGGATLVPIIAAGGEFVLSPHEVAWFGGDDNLDDFVKAARKKHIDTLKKLKPPKKD